jgi:drug/metabolite transporter (DMT)-like permease
MTANSRGGPKGAYLAGLGWASIFGLSFLVTKDALGSFSPFELLFLRFALATAALALLAAFGLVRLEYRGKPKPILALICLFQPIVYFSCETFGLRETATSTAGLILGALPVAVAALSAPMLKEKLRLGQVFGLALTIAGVALVVLARSAPQGGGDSLRGILLLLGALASAAFYNVFSRRASSAYSPAEITFAMMASGAAFFGSLACAQDALGRGFGAFASAPLSAWASVAYLGLLSSVLAFFLINLSLSKLKAAQSAAFGALITLISLAAGVIVKGESLGLPAIAGAAAILGGVWATNKRGRATEGSWS